MKRTATLQKIKPQKMVTDLTQEVQENLKEKVKAIKDNGLSLIEKHFPTTNILEKIVPELVLYERVLLSPEELKDLLTLNTDNRPIYRSVWEGYAEDMKADKWKFAGNTFCFDYNRRMQNGQHTALAAIEAKKSIIVNIQCGLEPDAFTVMDTGKTRSASDILAMQGYKHHQSLASTIKTIIQWERSGKLGTNIKYSKVKNQDVEKFAERTNEMKLLVECLDYTLNFLRVKKGTFLAPSTWAFAYFITSKVHLEQAKEFMTLLATGDPDGLKRHPAIHLLREELIFFTDRSSKWLSQSGTVVTEIKLKYIIAAWNADRTGNVRKLKFDPKLIKDLIPQ